MHQLIHILLLLTLLNFLGCSDKLNPEFRVINLQCEYMKQALIAKQGPRFSWEVMSSHNNQMQTAWQVIVSDDKNLFNDNRGNVWDSGKTKGRAAFGIKMQGDALRSFTKYYWKIRSWDRDDKISDWSKPATFITGAYNKEDWKAKWIGDEPEEPLDYPLLYKHIGYLSSYAAEADEEKWVQLDLVESRTFNKVRIYPSYNDNRDIQDYYFPRAYRIEVSDNREDWTAVVIESSASVPKGEPVLHEFEEAKARYVRFTATKLVAYSHINFNPEDRYNRDKRYAFSLAELQLMDNEDLISLNCDVIYKDALIKLDRQNGYDPDMLTDGISNTPAPPEKRNIPPSPLLRKAITLKEEPVKALVYVSALGLYEFSINAQNAGHRVLAPEWTDYNKRVQYQAFDVSHMLHQGVNVIGAHLADGWYAGMLGPVRWSPYFPKRGAYGLDRRLFFQMEVEYPDGESETFVSDGSWKIFRDGPIRLADHFLGEKYDANKEIEGWLAADYDDTVWDNVFVDEGVDVNLVPQVNQPIRIIETLNAKSVTKSEDGHFIFDIGENIAGWCKVDLEGNPNDLIVLQHGEMLDEEGELYTDNLGMAVQIDSVILGHSGKLIYEPRFTYHGFRYVEVQGLQKRPDKSILEAKVITSDQPSTGYFSCSNPMLNQLYKNINRSHMSNMHGVPTDCPQRDERCGWMGDAYIFAQTSIYNRNMAAFYNKWIIDIMDAQSTRGTFPDIAPHPFAYEKHFTGVPGWADAGIQVPYKLYQNYGDREIIENHFESFEKYVEHIHRTNSDYIWRNGLGNNYGDWLNGNTLKAEGFPTTGAQIPSEVFATIMFYNSVKNLSKMALAIDKPDKASYYGDLSSKIKLAFAKEFIDSEGKIEGDAQSCYALALHYDIFPEKLEEKIEKRMIDKFIPYDGRMNTGFHSTLPLMKELVKRGYEEKAFQLLETKEFPSWGYSIEQGATSIWERWDGYVKGRGMQGAGMNSFNHYAFGAIGEWMYEHILGIQVDINNPGFTHFILKPLPQGTLTWAKGSYHSMSGKIEAIWEKSGNKFEYDVTVPANTSATLYMPSKSIESVVVNGQILNNSINRSTIGYSKGYTKFQIRSGKYKILSEL